MKSSILILLAALLAIAILAPSVITLVGDGENTAMVIDSGEEEKKEEKKETKEEDFIIDSYFGSFVALKEGKKEISNFYIEGSYNTSLVIFLLPPKHTL